MKIRSSVCMLVVVACASGCTKFLPTLTPPEAGGPPWRELMSEHVVLRTDRSEGDARDSLAALEQSYVALRDIGFPETSRTGDRITVVHFDRERDYQQFAPLGALGYFLWSMPNERRPEPTVVVWGDLDAAARHTFQHEVTHMFARASLGAMPIWLNEGLAQYYETLSLEGGYAYVGRPIAKRRAWPQTHWGYEKNGLHDTSLVPIGHVPSVEHLTQMDVPTFYGRSTGHDLTSDERKRRAANYLAAFGVVHMVLQDPKYQPYFDACMAYVSDDRLPVLDAWRRAFSQVGADEMEQDFRAHLLKKYDVTVLRTPYTPAAVVPRSVRVMPAADVHVLWARLRRWSTTGAQLAQRDLEKARLLVPDSAEVAFWTGFFQLATKGAKAAAPEIQRALTMRPRDPRRLLAAIQVYRELHEDAAGQPEYRALVARLAGEARSAFDFASLAGLFVEDGSWTEAYGAAVKATRLDPTCSRCFTILGIVLRAAKRYDDALRATEVALSLTGEEDTDQIRVLGARCDELRKLARKSMAKRRSR